jgi:hypothetical protein
MQEECLQKSGYFISIIPKAESTHIQHYEKKLQPYFEKVGKSSVFPLGDQAINFILIIPVDGYNGQAPEQTNKF